MNIDVFDINGKKIEQATLNKQVFGAEVNNVLLAQAVRVYLANQREASAKAKTRAEVDRSRKKTYRQKGTGGARHGDRRSPVYVGGGKALGPNGEQNFSLKLSQKMKQTALKSALSLLASEGKIIGVKGLTDMKAPKTKTIAELLQTILPEGVVNRAGMIFADKMDTAYKSARNIDSLKCYHANRLTTYDVLQSRKLVISIEALEALTKRLSK